MPTIELTQSLRSTIESVSDAELSLLFATEGMTQPEEWPYEYSTESTGGMLRLRDWRHLDDELADLVHRFSEGTDFRFLIVERRGTMLWAQTTPEDEESFRVELSDEAGWVDHLRSSRADGTWSSLQAAAIMRGWVSRRFQRADGTRARV